MANKLFGKYEFVVPKMPLSDWMDSMRYFNMPSLGISRCHLHANHISSGIVELIKQKEKSVKKQLTRECVKRWFRENDKPLSVTCSTDYFNGTMKTILIINDDGRYVTSNLGCFNLLDSTYKYYPSPYQTEFVTLYECWDSDGDTCLLTENGERVDFTAETFRAGQFKSLKRKTGRTVKLNLETFEIVND